MADRPPALIDTHGRPLRREELTREIAAPSTMGVRSILSGHPAQGLTPQKLARLLRDAEQGDPLAYLELAEEMEEKDPHYLAVLSTRKRQVAQLPVTVVAAGDSEEEKDDAQLVRDWLDRDLLEAELFDILDAMGKGYSATEMIWDLGPDLWQPNALKWRDPRYFEWDRVTGEELLLRDINGPQSLPGFKFIVHVHQAKSGLPVRGGLARVIAWGYMFKNYAIKDWVTFLETYGMPMRIGRYENGTSEPDIQLLKDALADLGSDAAAAFPKSMDITFENTTAGSTPEALWQKKAEYVDSQVSKAVLGQTGTTDMKSGGLGDGGNKVHDRVAGDIERADAKMLAATLNRDFVPAYVMLNRGPRRKYPRIRIGREDACDIGQMITNAGKLAALGVEIDGEPLREMAGLQAPAEGGIVLRAAIVSEPAEFPPVKAAKAPEGKSPAAATASALSRPLRGLPVDAEGIASGINSPARSEPDPIDVATDESLADWELLAEPVFAPIERLARDAGSLEELRDGLISSIASMDATQLVEALARGMFAARLAGDADARPNAG
ncbi:MAG: DUF935 domain-containing protein [Sphingomonadales bacterium]|nr:MAG: DUF935 domain-containing protein [Sphingomonadales bacterium]